MFKCRYLIVWILSMTACAQVEAPTAAGPGEVQPVGATLTRARAADGSYISWREHIIDDESTAGSDLRGSDGLTMGDLDRDGFLDIVSVHESDTEYDGVP